MTGWALAGGLCLVSGCFLGSSGADCAPGNELQCVCTCGHTCVGCNLDADCKAPSKPVCTMSYVCAQCPHGAACTTAPDGQHACLPPSYQQACKTSSDCGSALETCIQDPNGNDCGYKCP